MSYIQQGGAAGGSGTVTSVSGAANQIDVATGTTTPALTLSSTLVAPGTVSATTSVTSPFYASAAADVADAGAIRLGNAEIIAWEASPTSTDVTLTVDSAETFQFSNAAQFPAGTSTAPSVAVRQATQGMSASSTSTVNLICGIAGGHIQFGDTTSPKLDITSASSPTIAPVNTSNNITIQGTVSSQALASVVLSNGAFNPSTTVNQGSLAINGAWSPTAAAPQYFGLMLTPTINQTGGSNGTVRLLSAYAVNTALVGTEYLLALGTTSASGLGGTLTDKLLIDNNGITKNYAGIATVSQGQPAEYATVDLTAQTAAITATTLYAVPAGGAGMYRISWSATITTAASVSSVLGGTNGFQILYTSPTDSVVKTTVTGNSITSAANTTATAVGGVEIVYAKLSTNIQYQYDYTSSGTAMAYELHLKIEAL